MGSHIIDGEFQSDKYPETPRGLVPLKPTDPMAQDLLWEYAQRRREVDAEFSDDLEEALKLKGFDLPKLKVPTNSAEIKKFEQMQEETREDSGNIIGDRLSAFFYHLMRDHLPFGVISGLVKQVMCYREPVKFTNGWLAKGAKHYANRLRKTDL